MVDDELPSAAWSSSATTARGLLGDRLAWAIAAALVALTAVVAGLLDDIGSPPSMLVFAALPIVAVAVALADLLRRGSFVGAAAVLVAVTPTVVAAFSGGRKQGAMAAAAAVTGVLIARPTPAKAAGRAGLGAAVGAALLVVWVRQTPDVGPVPSWSTILRSTGRFLWETVGTVGGVTRVPTSAWLAWWVAVGIVVGAALVAGHVAAAVAVAGGVGAFVAAAWLLTAWRGGADMTGGTWLVAGPLAWAGASVHLERTRSRRLAGGVAALVATIWLLTIIHLVRR